ncbi:MAG: hypothetical protein Q4A62_03380 [Eikenella sp.]|nr:hypothetical protein [Eikenella sp.]
MDDQNAIHTLASLYVTGEYLTQDYAKSLQILSDAKSEEAIFLRASIYYKDWEGRNLDRAKDEFEYLANRYANSDAMLFLGFIYQDDNYQFKDINTANQWFEESSRKGNSTAKLMLSLNYINGVGVIRNHEKAYLLARDCAFPNNLDCYTAMGVILLNGEYKNRIDLGVTILMDAKNRGDELAGRTLEAAKNDPSLAHNFRNNSVMSQIRRNVRRLGREELSTVLLIIDSSLNN